MLNTCPYFFLDDVPEPPAYGDEPPAGHCMGAVCPNYLLVCGECVGWLMHFAANNRQRRTEAKRARSN